jgi:glycosyltransferase involved in cell wall biosynthesis
MKILQLSNLPLMDVYEKFKNGQFIDRHNTLYGYDYLLEHGHIVIPVSHYKKTFLSKIVNRTGFLIWGDNADFYLQLIAMLVANKEKVEVVYCHFSHISCLIAFFRRIGVFKIPLIVVAHDAFSQKTTSIKNLKGVDRVLFLCERTLDLCKKKEDISSINCSYIDWGADLDLFEKYFFLQKEAPKYDSIISTGVANRDYDTIVKAMIGVENLKLNILSSNCNINTNQPNNVFIDRVMSRSSTSKVLPYYYDAIATLIPLKEKLDFGNGGTVMMESMAMRKPIIITSSRANLLDVKKEKIGLEVDYGDINGWRDAILYIKEHPNEAKEMGDRGYYLAKKRYNYINYSKQILFEIENLKNNF